MDAPADHTSSPAPSGDDRETRTARISRLAGPIVVARIGNQAQTLEDARENLAACALLAGPARSPLLVDMRAARPLLPEVRHQYMGERLDASFRALGLLVRGTPLGLAMGNAYLRIARPGIPTRIFSEESLAVAWLRERI